MLDKGRTFRSIRFFSAGAFCFALAVALFAWLIDLQQRQVLDETRTMELTTMPEIVRLQRLGRNLEQLRSTGEAILTATTVADRQDALLMMTMISTHPSVREDPAIAELTVEASRILTEANLAILQDANSLPTWRARWQPIALRLSQSADDAMSGSVQLLAAQVDSISVVARQVRNQMWLIVGLAGACILLFVWVLQIKILRPLLKINDAMRSLSSSLAPPVLPNSDVREIRAIESVILALHEAQKKTASVQEVLVYQATHDMLSGLPNRRAFMESAERAALRAVKSARHATVGMVDIDFFKRINDLYGHPAGDAVLRDIARLILESFRSTDPVCRYGGEEFAFVVLESNITASLTLAERLRERVATHVFTTPAGAVIDGVTISIGLAAIGPEGLEAAIAEADTALYRAKASGRNCTRT